ncbi:uncharacterized protein [Onthophagus taurus]|uniref:uncharacterized protein n=1 Tax=Onthophagus taurus TaxID=166361 RepID=UPI000C200A0D|nr:uncharacterized protein LOC111424410 [Onthophagus taurus]
MKIVLFACCIILGINAYEFDDALYNQYLAKDFESLIDDQALTHRIRRQSEDPRCRKPQGPPVCCGKEDFLSIDNDLRDLKKQCYKEVTGQETFHGKPFDPFNCDDVEKLKKDLICVKQCVGKKKGCLDAQGNLVEDVARKFMTEHTTMEWLKPKLNDMMTKCFAEAKKATENMNKSVDDACNPALTKFEHCMFRETQFACPADQIQDQRTCAIVRQFAKHSTFLPVVGH